MVDDFDILPRGVENLHDIRIGHQFEQRGEIDTFCERIDQHLKRRACHLHETKLRPEGGFAQKLGVDGNEFRFRQFRAGFGEGGSRFNHCKWPLVKIIRLTFPLPGACQYKARF
ncbi:hypothetical protein D3C72_1257310 [compost metagenome]